MIDTSCRINGVTNEGEVTMRATFGVVNGVWSACSHLSRLDNSMCSTIDSMVRLFTSSKRRRDSIEGIGLNIETSFKITF